MRDHPPGNGPHQREKPEKDTSGWLAPVKESLSRLSGESSPQQQYILLQTALDELDRQGREHSRLPRQKALAYIECSLAAFEQGQVVFAHHALLSRVLERARRYALALGDKRSTAILDLQLGRVFWLLNKPEEGRQACARGLAAIDVLEDKSFAEYAGRFLILYHTLQGEPLKVLNTYKSIRSSLDADWDAFVFNHIIPVVALNAAFVGQFRFGKRLLKNAWRTAQTHGHASAEKHLEANLGWLLAASGELTEARLYLTDGIGVAEAFHSPARRFWNQRVMAYLLYAEGDIHGAYQKMREAKAMAAKDHLQMSPFLAPWILQMLRAFHWAGLPPISGFDYESEMERIRNGSNLFMKGVAYRLLAIDAGQKQAPIDEQLELFRHSEKLLEHVSGNIELAKTWIEMARVYLKTDETYLAKATITKAWQVFAHSAPPLFPQDLYYLVEHVPDPAERAGIWPTYSNLIDTLAQLPVPITRHDLYSRLANIACSFFGAERVGLFVSDENTGAINLESSYNIPSLDAEVAYEEAALELIHHAFKAEEPAFSGAFEEDRESATMLCIPLTASKTKMALYLAASGAMDIFYELSPTQIPHLAKHVGELFSMLLNLLGATEDAYRQNIGLVTTGGTASDNNLLYRSAPMVHTIHLADLAAQSDVSVIILGETGAGKEVVARHIHRQSTRRDMPFVTVDLTTLPESLVESELFGHEKGSFTGANEQRAGQVELADKGTLFIDEIGDAPLSIQLKLLRVLQEKTYRRVGGTQVLTSDFRLIVATNKDLQSAAREGRFREDLYYRLNVIAILLPPLREREDDILYLAAHFLTYFSRKHGRPAPVLTKDHERSLKAYGWPGNVRELKNLMERVIVLRDDSLLYVGTQREPASLSRPEPLNVQPTGFSSPTTLDEMEAEYITQIIARTEGRISGKNGAARILGINRSTLYHRMKKLGIPYQSSGRARGYVKENR